MPGVSEVINFNKSNLMCFVCGSIYCMIYFWAFMYAIDVNVFYENEYRKYKSKFINERGNNALKV